MRCFVLFFSSFFWFFQKQNSQKMELVWVFFWSSIKKNVPTTNARELHLCSHSPHVPLSHGSVCCYRLATVQWFKLHLTVCWRAQKRSSLQRTRSSSGFAFFFKKNITWLCVLLCLQSDESFLWCTVLKLLWAVNASHRNLLMNTHTNWQSRWKAIF